MELDLDELELTTTRRQIVHIKDVFPGIEVESAQKASPDTETNNNQNKVGNYKPKIFEASNTSDVIFGDVKGLADFQGSRRNRKKAAAPRPPVLIDIDVGFTEQMEGEKKVEKEKTPPKLFRSNRKVASPPTNKSKVEGPSDSLNLDVGAFMSSLSQGLSEGKNPLFDDAQNGNQEQSSSGVDTDDNATPNGSYGTKAGVTPAGKVAAVEKLAPVSGKDTETEQEYSEDDDEDEFEEDEAMLEFDEEEEQIEGTNRQIYQEYYGEDYSQYLNDDCDEVEKARRKFRRRKGKKKKKQPVEGNVPDSSAVPEEPSESMPNAPSNEHVAKPSSLTKTLRLKLGGLFHGQSENGERVNASPANIPIFGSNIHSFTFADSKIGNTISDKEIDGSMISMKSDSSVTAEAKSKLNSKRWWNKETLSAQTMPGNSDIMLKARRSSVLPKEEEDEEDIYSTISDPTGETTTPSTENGHAYGENIADLTQDFESYRKNTMYNTKKKKVPTATLR